MFSHIFGYAKIGVNRRSGGPTTTMSTWVPPPRQARPCAGAAAFAEKKLMAIREEEKNREGKI